MPDSYLLQKTKTPGIQYARTNDEISPPKNFTFRKNFLKFDENFHIWVRMNVALEMFDWLGHVNSLIFKF